MAVFYASASLSGAFSGLLAYGIEQMDGIAGQYEIEEAAYRCMSWHLVRIRTFWLAVDVRMSS
jgi:hypothetical protein